MRGMFISLEGAEGVGKSTQIPLLFSRLRDAGYRLLLVREPGGTGLGEKVRQILLTQSEEPLLPLAELLLFSASRHQLVERVIRPALERGDLVLCDRFFDSTVAYQGYGRGLNLSTVEQLIELSTSGLRPDLTLVLDLPDLEGVRRARVRSGGTGDRFEGEAADFHRRVREGFLTLAQREPARVKVVDASGTIEETAQAIGSLVDHELQRHYRS